MKTLALERVFIITLCGIGTSCTPRQQPNVSPTNPGDEITTEAATPLFSVKIDDRWGFIRIDGTQVIPAKFGSASGFSEGLAAAYDMTAKKWGFIDVSGQYVIEPSFDEAEVFSEGFALVRKNGDTFFINRLGIRVSDNLAREVGAYLREGLTTFRRDGKVGFLDATGRTIIEPKFDDVRIFSDGLAPVESGRTYTEYYLKDITGRLRAHRSPFPGKWGYANRDGELVIAPAFDGALSFSEGLAGVKVNEKWGFIDRSGTIVHEPVYDEVQPYSEGLACVIIDGKTGYIDSKGNLMIPERYESGRPFSEGLAAVKLDGAWGYIDKRGTMVIAPKYTGAFEFKHGLAITWTEGPRWGYINARGQEVWRQVE